MDAPETPEAMADLSRQEGDADGAAPESRPAHRPGESVELLQYEILALRRQGFDSLMWQSPALSLTAQAFLLAIAFGADAGRLASIVGGLLSLIVSLMSVQLMLRHRQHEKLDSIRLQAIEKDKGWPELFAPSIDRLNLAGQRHSYPIRLRSHVVWAFGLGIFGAAGLLAALLALFFPGHIYHRSGI